MAVAYRAVELADVCYIFEFAYWMALGQIPEIAPNEDGEEARRLPQEHDDQFKPIIDATLFLSEEEIASFLPEVDGSKYMTAQVDVYGRTADEIIARSDELLSGFANEVEPDFQEYLDRQRRSDLKDAEAAKWLHEVSAPVRRLIDQARAKVFLALSEGNIRAHGFVPKFDEIRNIQFCEIVAIPPEAWSLDTIDWLSASTIVDGTEVIGAHVKSNEMLAFFPPSELRGEPISGKVTGGLFIPDQDGMASFAVRTSSRRRGRPTKGNGLIETAIRNEFRRLTEAGEISNKKEANIQMMIEWAERILGETVSRTSVQRWLEQSLPSAQK